MDRYEQAALRAGWFKLKRGWFHVDAYSYWGWGMEFKCYPTAEQLCKAENIEVCDGE